MTAAAPVVNRRRNRRWGTIVLYVVTALGLLYLFVPLGTIAVFTFNEPSGRFNTSWQQFTWDNWRHAFDGSDYVDALRESIKVAIIACSLATVLGGLIALAISRYRMRGGALDQPPPHPPAHHTGDRPRSLAVHVVLQPGGALRFLDHRAGTHDVLPVVRRPHDQGQDARSRLDVGGRRRRPRFTAAADVRAYHLADDRAGHRRRLLAVAVAVDRRLHHHVVHRRTGLDVPSRDLRLVACGDRPAGSRSGHHHHARRRHACSSSAPSSATVGKHGRNSLGADASTRRTANRRRSRQRAGVDGGGRQRRRRTRRRPHRGRRHRVGRRPQSRGTRRGIGPGTRGALGAAALRRGRELHPPPRRRARVGMRQGRVRRARRRAGAHARPRRPARPGVLRSSSFVAAATGQQSPRFAGHDPRRRWHHHVARAPPPALPLPHHGRAPSRRRPRRCRRRARRRPLCRRPARRRSRRPGPRPHGRDGGSDRPPTSSP